MVIIAMSSYFGGRKKNDWVEPAAYYKTAERSSNIKSFSPDSNPCSERLSSQRSNI